MKIQNELTCQACGSTALIPHLEVKDYFFSGESFELYHCNKCQLLITSPQPSEEKLSSYYQSPDYISHTNRITNFITLAYKIVRNLSINNKYLLVNKYTDGSKILDVGCGTGYFLAKMKSRNWQIQGVEPDTTARSQAEKILNQPMASSLYEIREKYPAITLWHVLEHMPDLNKVVAYLQSILQEKGTLFVALPNHESYDASFYKQYWAGYDVPRHLYHFNKNSVKNLMSAHQLKVTHIMPMYWDSFYVAMLSEKYKHGKNRPVHAFWKGLVSNLKASEKMNYSSLIYVIKHV